MANPHPNTANLRPAQKGEVRNPKGRPEDKALKAAKELYGNKRARELRGGMTQGQIDGWEQLLLAMTSAETALLAKWEGCPNYPKSLAMALLYDMKNGRTATIDKLRERQFGKPIQKVELTGRDGAPLLPDPRPLTQEEAREFIRQLEQEY